MLHHAAQAGRRTKTTIGCAGILAIFSPGLSDRLTKENVVMREVTAKEISQAELAEVLKLVSEDMIAAEGEFQALDAALGDGDLGITAKMGFQAIREVCQKSDQISDIGSLLSAAGKAFMNANASTMGALTGTAWLQAGKVAGLKTTITLGDTVAMCRAAAEGIRRRGKAQLGDKTILDAIFPACDALAKADQDGESCAKAFVLAAEAAEHAVADTAPLQSQVSRASWLQERSKGLPDPGASLCAKFFRSVANRLVSKHLP
jgi:dihydroxyacetone kinase-like protein